MLDNMIPVQDILIEDRLGRTWKIRIAIPDDLPPIAKLDVIAELMREK